MKNSLKGMILIVILILVLIATLVGGVLYEKSQQAKGSVSIEPEDNSVVDKIEDIEEPEKEVVEEIINPLVKKLRGGENIRVLVLGDGIALGSGSTGEEGKWDKVFSKWITDTYGSQVELVSLAQAGITTEVGYTLAERNNIQNYDIAIVCHGQMDKSSNINIDKFRENYKGIIEKLKLNNKDITILAVQPSTVADETQYASVIKEVVNEQEATLVNMYDKTMNSGIDYNTLVGPRRLPNENGYSLYSDALKNEIIKLAP